MYKELIEEAEKNVEVLEEKVDVERLSKKAGEEIDDIIVKLTQAV